MSNTRKLRRLNRSSGQLSRFKRDWGATALMRREGFSRKSISRWLNRGK